MEFNNDIQIGDEFYSTPKKKILNEVVDIVKTFSTAKNQWNEKVIFVAKGINTLATNTFEVSKATIVRNRK